jgi:hypothetical protein
MPVEIVVDSIDTVEESLRPAYVENQGKFNLDPDKYFEVKLQSSGLKKKNSDLIATNKQIKESSKRYEPFANLTDDDLNEILEWRENKDKTPPGDDKAGKGSEDLQAQFEKALNKEKTRFASEKTELETKLTDLDKQVKHYKLTVPLRDIAAKAGVIAEDMDLVLLDTAKRFALNEDGDIVVLDEDGDPTDITPQKFFETLYREQRPKFYAASGAAGSGAPSGTSRGGVKTMTISEFDKLPLPSQASYAAEVRQGKAKLID